ncbi:MAG: S8 family serine peptidase, partial [Actinomycetota bacterium]|nr:S8 family serine peptidase [Actinomycetota bacterium]
MHVVDVLSATVGTTLADFAADPSVQSVDRDRTRDAGATPNDPSYPDQWSLPKIGWDQVYGTLNPSSSTIAVLDTGVDGSIADLSGHLVPGFSAFGTDPTTDPNGHGTWMASIAAATADNSSGIAGVDYTNANVMPVQVLDPNGTGQDSDIIAGVVYAADHGANVILMSFSNPGFSQALQDAVDYAWSNGAVVVAATGNDGVSTPTYPAGDAKVVGVSATDQSDNLWSSSNDGADAFIAAPGVSVLADAVGGGVTSITGTSAAAANVAGAAALLKGNDPSVSNAVIIGRLGRNADPAGTGEQTGNGRLNLARALSDTSLDGVTPAGAPGGGPLVGPYVAAANLAVTATYDATTTTITATITGANSAKFYNITYASPSGSSIIHTCVASGGSGGNVTFTDSATLPSGFTPGTWTITVDEFNNGQGCSGNSNKTASASTTATVTTPGTISGTVFNDANSNGSIDNGEGLVGATVSLYRDSNSNGVYDSGTDVQVGSTQTITDANTGAWSFGSLGINNTYFAIRTNPAGGYVSTNAVPGTDTNATTTKITNDQLKVVLNNVPGASSVGNKFIARQQADLVVTKTDGTATYTPGGSTTYTIVFSNAGPSNVTGATIADSFPAAITSSPWTCVAAGGATCTAASGTGNISGTINLPVGGTATYTVTASISASATGNLSNTATITAPAGVTEINTANNTATDTDTQASSANLSVTKTDGTATYTPGGSTTYTIVFSNAGPSNVTGAT